MPSLAKAYIALIAVAGALVLAAAGLRWSSENLTRFLVFFFLALVASALKVRLPGMKGTMSMNFVFILVGIPQFSFSQMVVLGFAGALLQSLWKPRQRPKPVQLLFNVSCLAVSTALAYGISHFVLKVLGTNSLAAMLSLAGCCFLLVNTGLVTMVIALSEERPPRQVWQQCYEWVFPCFLVGSAVAGLASASGSVAGWEVSLLVLPTAYFAYVYFRMQANRAVQTAPQPPSHEADELLVGASQRR